jgi:hypothetical protein
VDLQRKKTVGLLRRLPGGCGWTRVIAVVFPFGGGQAILSSARPWAQFRGSNFTEPNPRAGRKVLFEALEPRILLSADLPFTAVASQAIDLILRLQDHSVSPATLKLINNRDGHLNLLIASDLAI